MRTGNMARYKLVLEYNGAGLIGFQKNRQGPSVQSLVEDAALKFSGQAAEVVPCGRTDAGVHAAAMPAHFDLTDRADDADTVKRALNFYLTDSPVSVVSCEAVPGDWHARFSCKRRSYRYVIINQDFPPVLERDFAWWVPQPLDIGAMRTAASSLIGTHNFTSFRAVECQAKSPVKTLDEVRITGDGPRITMDFFARSFLYRQVRNMVGTLVEIGRGRPLDMDAILAAQDRTAAGPTAPACGLFFMSADY